MTVYYTFIPSPVGDFMIAGSDTALHCTSFTEGDRQRMPKPDWQRDHTPLMSAVDQFSAYFAGENIRFDIPLAPDGTLFQRTVWEALLEIPYGKTWSYGKLARRIGNPGASRAVGAANGANPLPVVIPCHRVIGADGSLTGFGGGMAAKAMLLRLEGIAVDDADKQLQLI